MRIVFIFFISVFLFGCSKPVEGMIDEYDGPIQSVLVSNFTGHLIRQSRDYCGDGIKVAFVISTDRATDTYYYEPDTYRQLPFKMERGEQVTIKAFEMSEGGTFLAQKTVTYNPPTESTSQARPEVVLCPKDQLLIFDFD